jgi:glycosyltransferase involved in cell wall biosynthesis
MEPLRRGWVDLVLPVHNEARVLARSAARLAEAMDRRADFPWRIVIAENGSTDATLDVARRLADESPSVAVLHREAAGRGGALRQAWSETTSQFSLYMDVDLSTGLEAVGQAVALLRGGADLVVGSRLDRRSRITRSLRREVLSRGYNRLVRLALGTRSFDDAQCGFKGVSVASIRPLLPLVRNDEWFFDTELLVLAEYAGLGIRSLPITWVEDADSRVNIPRTIWEDLCGLARLRRTARRLVREHFPRPPARA